MKKNIPLTDNYLNKGHNDGVYGYLLSKSHGYDYEGKKETIVFFDNFSKCEIAKKLGVTTRTIDRHIRKLKQDDLLQEIWVCNKKSYIFKRQRIFQEIELDILNYLIDNFSENRIRLYAYLLNKFLWKSKKSEIYQFDIKEIIQKVYGLKSTTNGITNEKILRDNIDALKDLGLIDFRVEWIQIPGINNKTRRLLLTNVSTKMNNNQVRKSILSTTKKYEINLNSMF